MNKVFINSILLAFVFLLGIGASEAGGQTVSGSVGNGTVSRGKTVRGVITLDIPAGLHVNSNKPDSEYSIPTTVRLTAPGAKVSGVSYPAGKNRKFQFSENSINVYEGRVSFPFGVTVPSNFSGSTLRVRALIRYQACTDEVCYPPRTKDITITARVR